MMVKTQITLEDEDHQLAKLRAHELGISLSEFVRRAIRKELGGRPQRGDISEIFGMFNSGRSDISSRIDEIVEQDSWDDHMRTRDDA